MKQDEIIQMARPAEWLGNVEGWTFNTYQQLETFAKLVAAKEQEKFSADLIEYGKAMAAVEREACALIAEKRSEPGTAAFIRARGEA